MKPEDIVTTIHAAGATITTDGEHITVSPKGLVQPMVMAEAKAKTNREKLLSHLIETGRVSADGVEAAGARRRLVKGRELLWEKTEAQIVAEGIEGQEALFETLLKQYEGFCDTAREAVVA